MIKENSKNKSCSKVTGCCFECHTGSLLRKYSINSTFSILKTFQGYLLYFLVTISEHWSQKNTAAGLELSLVYGPYRVEEGGGNTSVVHMRDPRFSKRTLITISLLREKTLNENFARFLPQIYP